MPQLRNDMYTRGPHEFGVDCARPEIKERIVEDDQQLDLKRTAEKRDKGARMVVKRMEFS
jgi:hypothetical protein